MGGKGTHLAGILSEDTDAPRTDVLDVCDLGKFGQLGLEEVFKGVNVECLVDLLVSALVPLLRQRLRLANRTHGGGWI